ncbi:hypothetical protein IU474_07130 [Nocardia otitidiscaviarum]|uniref:hypothetical protein n=1 Tax=Nocardia otitidiscaviarum TaxID=1823 RepID=UPI001895F48D|nr:hypothetical protein [Nocardia otitidiscaviarum]MBF6236850.1 hypothetical protein [Nocardia otitidiscaviarum]
MNVDQAAERQHHRARVGGGRDLAAGLDAARDLLGGGEAVANSATSAMRTWSMPTASTRATVASSTARRSFTPRSAPVETVMREQGATASTCHYCSVTPTPGATRPCCAASPSDRVDTLGAPMRRAWGEFVRSGTADPLRWQPHTDGSHTVLPFP